jgi:glutamate-1-semialdehyde 2,1-aminomutase
MNIIAIVQARMGSTRYPGKVMQLIDEKPVIELLLSRLSAAESIDKIVLATSTDDNNKPLIEHVKKLGYEVFTGSENDVLDRFYNIALQNKPDAIVRITGDCPLIDAKLLDEMVAAFKSQQVDYLSNTLTPSFPDGLDIEIFLTSALYKVVKSAKDAEDREHVTSYIYSSGHFETANYANNKNYSSERWTLDEVVDLDVITNIFQHFQPCINFTWKDVIELKKQKPELFKANEYLTRNAGANLGTGQKLWRRAKSIIPGGNMFLSKRAEMFLPDQWPAYFSKAQGCKIWDLDGKEYIDMSLMSIGTNILGYANPEVDEQVHETVSAGNMSTFNCPEEVYLAEKMISMHPWAEKVRFARSGGEANAIAIRIARAASGKDNVAICGYHGWHDWYLSANLSSDKNLSGHLLPGLTPNGVPQNLEGTVFPFAYNNIAELETLVEEKHIGVIKMEVTRNTEPEKDFLKQVRKLATDNNIVLIFDECTSGFRQSFGGIHKLYDVSPDIAVFGKALGNGYAITAVIGRSEVMEAAQSTFISSTFWTERIGPTAALKTLEVMERNKSWEQITQTGKMITKRWKSLARTHELSITTSGLSALTSFTFNYPDSQAYKTLITQEMLEQGYLASTSVYVCTEHSNEIVDDYFTRLDPVFGVIKECVEGRDITSLLKGPVCHSGFKRIT